MALTRVPLCLVTEIQVTRVKVPAVLSVVEDMVLRLNEPKDMAQEATGHLSRKSIVRIKLETYLWF